ncbi:hypothetical protein JYU34_022056, partial [Plutella xylostella]
VNKLFLSFSIPVPPNKISVSGVGEHVTHGTLVTLVCAVSGAKPAATLAWFNGSEAVDHTTRDVKDKNKIVTSPLSTHSAVPLNIQALMFDRNHLIRISAPKRNRKKQKRV